MTHKAMNFIYIFKKVETTLIIRQKMKKKVSNTALHIIKVWNNVQISNFQQSIIASASASARIWTYKSAFNASHPNYYGSKTLQYSCSPGSRQVGRVVSVEKGQQQQLLCVAWVQQTVLLSLSPLFLFKTRWNINKLQLKNCPAGALGLPSAKAWIVSDS